MKEIIYFIVYIILINLYVLHYSSIIKNYKKIMNNEDSKKFDVYASLHTLLFSIFSVIFLVYNIVFVFYFLNKYDGTWHYILPIGIVAIIMLVIVTITGFKVKNKMLKEYEDEYGYPLHFYGQVRFISLFRHVCIMNNYFLLINIITILR